MREWYDESRAVRESRGLLQSPDDDGIVIRGPVWGAPDLVVEVLSSSSTHYDREEKRTWYAQYGVRELWVADPRTATVGVVDLTNPAADIVMGAGPQIVRSRVLPRLRMKASNAFV